MTRYPNEIVYSERYYAEGYEWRFVRLPKEITRSKPSRILSVREWRELGVQMSTGWENYVYYTHERNVLLFKRPVEEPNAVRPIEIAFE
jgi:cyclin-dependent kinase regulatory subunit CKS1